MAGSRAPDESELEQLAEEQIALRRVAMLVARSAPVETVLTVAAEEVSEVLRVPLVSIVRYEADGTATERASVSHRAVGSTVGTRWSLDGTNVVAQVRDTAEPARIDDYCGLTGAIADACRRGGIRSTVGIPIVVGGRLWGAMAVSSADPDTLPAKTEAHLVDFAELVAAAIANGEAREQIQRLAVEQAALRHVATLVAADASRAEVFTAIAEEIGRLLGVEETQLLHFEDDRTAVVMARWGRFDALMPVGARLSLEDESATAQVLRTGTPARIDYASARGATAERARASGVRCALSTPILVDGHLWGAMVTGTSQDDSLPPETESRLAAFTELMATAIANTEGHARAERLAEEQAALRRVATVVAKESSPAEVFEKVTDEVARALGGVDCTLFRDEGDGIATVMAVAGRGVKLGSRWPVDGDGVIATVLQERRPHRRDNYSAATGALARYGRDQLGISSAAGCPIMVRGRVWGALGAAGYGPEPLPAGAEVRMAQFGELIATAIANADARAEVERLAHEQSALRRVATLVAEGASPEAVFDAVAAEMAGLLDADGVAVSRYEPDGGVTVVADRGAAASRERGNVTDSVLRSGQSARIDDHERTVVGAPIVVEGRLWGVVVASWSDGESPPRDTEGRMAQFGELLDTAIANADSRDQLIASRERLVTAADDARRLVVRDLHDGAQQRLVHTIVTLKLLQRALLRGDGDVEPLVGEALGHAQAATAELRELAHGILPAALTRGGLPAAIDSVVARIDLPVHVDLPAARLPSEIEASAYFIVAEALTNVVKHAEAGRAAVKATVGNGMLRLEVRDDGVGGADPAGHGLVGIDDRVTALRGRLEVESPAGGGTLVAATLPLRRGARVPT